MAKITYTDKVNIKDIPVAEINKFTAINANEIKTVVNGLDDIKSSFLNVSTYSDLLLISPETHLIIIKVLNDENKGMNNTIYHIYPDGTRMWMAAVEDI